MNKKHRDNLLKLAAYLEALPEDYGQFDMGYFNAEVDDYNDTIDLPLSDRKYDCGTVACAVGHGPAAGIRAYGDFNWGQYARRVFGTEVGDDNFNYMFGACWERFDNTAKGAAARIRTYVEAGGEVPVGWDENLEEDGW